MMFVLPLLWLTSSRVVNIVTWPTSVTPPSQLWLVCFSRQLGPSEKTHVGWPLDPLISAQLICYIALRTPWPPQPRCVLKQTCWMEQCRRTPPRRLLPSPLWPGVLLTELSWIEVSAVFAVTDSWALEPRTRLRRDPISVVSGGVTTRVSKKQDRSTRWATFLVQASKADLDGAQWSLLALATELPLFGEGQTSRVLFDNFRLHNLKKTPKTILDVGDGYSSHLNLVIVDFAFFHWICCFDNKWVTSIITCLLFSS